MQLVHEMQTGGCFSNRIGAGKGRVGMGPCSEGLIVAHGAPSDLLVLVGVIAREIKVLPDLIIENKGGTKYQALGFGF